MQKILMHILDVPKPLRHRLVTDLTIHYFLIRKICFEDPIVSSLIGINWLFLLYLKPIVKFNKRD